MTSPPPDPEPDPAPTARVRAIHAYLERQSEADRRRKADQERLDREQAERDAADVAAALAGSPLRSWLPGVEWVFDGRLDGERKGIVVRSVDADGNAEPLRLALRPAAGGVPYAGEHQPFTVYMAPAPGVRPSRPLRHVSSLADVGAALADDDRWAQTKSLPEPEDAP